MELLGLSLESLFHLKNHNFSFKIVCLLGLQMLDRIKYVHSKKIILGDIKQDNFYVGRGNNAHILYILDFGLSKKYWSSTVKCHIPFMRSKKLMGTSRHASINDMIRIWTKSKRWFRKYWIYNYVFFKRKITLARIKSQ